MKYLEMFLKCLEGIFNNIVVNTLLTLKIIDVSTFTSLDLKDFLSIFKLI